MSAASNASAAGALDEAYRRGFADGASTLDAESEQQRDDAMEALGAALKGLSNVATEVRARLSANLSALALAVARQLLEREVEVDPTVVRGLVQKALAATPLAGVVTVRLHPADLSALGDPTAFRPPSGAPFELKWVADPTLMRGGCVVETPAAVVDGRVDHALLELYERLSRE
ncbi:MAG: hypothetical protein HOP28_06720 [Gemmatimonadales bacterium]|nr:hypothetical protein [Gemmatimonadales bacterium]